MKWQSRDNAHKSRRHSAFGSQLARQERGANRGRFSVDHKYLRSLKLRAGKGRREKKRVGCHASGRDAQSSAGRGRGICGDGGV